MLTSNAAPSGVALAVLTQELYFIVVMVTVVLVDFCANFSAAGQRRHTILLNTNKLHNTNKHISDAPEPMPITAVEDLITVFRNLDRSRRFLHRKWRKEHPYESGRGAGIILKLTEHRIRAYPVHKYPSLNATSAVVSRRRRHPTVLECGNPHHSTHRNRNPINTCIPS